MEKISSKKIDTILVDYLKKIAGHFSVLAIKRHINKHAKEIYDDSDTPEEWIASMRNLVDIYEYQCRSKPDQALRLRRLHEKWLSNKNHYTPPPQKIDFLIK
ncbi:MAG: hypothetical protein WC027_02245 [Candidatus Paceibacterota bacterium]